MKAYALKIRQEENTNDTKINEINSHKVLI